MSKKKAMFFGGGFNYLLNKYSNSVVAFSVTKLSSSATKCLGISTDGGVTVQYDILLYDNPLLIVDIDSMCSNGLTYSENKALTGDGNVIRWYDQSGNGNDMKNDSQISLPSMFFGNIMQPHFNADFLAIDTYLSELDSGNSFQIIARTSLTSASDICIEFTTTNSQDTARFGGLNNKTASIGSYCVLDDGITEQFGVMTDTGVNGTKLNMYNMKGSIKTLESWSDGVRDVDLVYTGNYVNDLFRIGFQKIGSNALFLLGYQSELIVFTNQESNKLDILDNRNNVWNAF